LENDKVVEFLRFSELEAALWSRVKIFKIGYLSYATKNWMLKGKLATR
jgi:hypothetical protein